MPTRSLPRPAVVLASALATATLVVTGCGGSASDGGTSSTGDTASSAPLPSVSADDALAAAVPEAIKEDGVITVGSDTTYAPNEFIAEDGETIVIAAGRTPRVLARNKLDARQLASPAIAQGRLFIRSDDALYGIGK